MKHILIYILLLTSCAMTACGGDSNGDAIEAAEQAVAAGDYKLARSICDTFVTDSTSTLNAGELCRLSLIYMKMSDIDDSGICTAAATQCYQSALRADSDSARMYYDNVPIDEARHVEIMMQLDRMLSGGEHDWYIDEDSLYIQLPDSLI